MQATKRALQQRNDMINLVAAASKVVQAAKTQNAKTTAALDAAATTLSTARSTRDTAIATASRCDAEERIRRADQELRDQEFELLRMVERLQHVASADTAAATASAVVSATMITDQLRTKIRNAEVKLKTEQGILNSTSPQFTITALKSVEVVINGEPLTLSPGQVRMVPVSEPVSAKIGSMVELRVEPGTNAETLSQAATNAEGALAKACGEAGVESPEEAETVWIALLDAKRTVADRDRIAKEHLRDLTREELGERIRVAKAKVDAYLAKRNTDVVFPATSEECNALLELATKAASDGETGQTKAEAVFAEVQEHHSKCREAHARIAATLEREQQDFDKAVDRLEEERNRCSDDELGNALTSAETNAKAALAAMGRKLRRFIVFTFAIDSTVGALSVLC